MYPKPVSTELSFVAPSDRRVGSLWRIPARRDGLRDRYSKKLIKTILLGRMCVYPQIVLPSNEKWEGYCNKLFVILIDDLMDYHNGCPVSQYDLHRIDTHIASCSEFDFLNELEANSVPIAILRAILYRDHATFDAAHVPNWIDFAETYGPYIDSGNEEGSTFG